jgi:hypothetical protein
MKTPRPFRVSPHTVWMIAVAGALVASPAALFGQKRKSNPASKVFVTDVAGEAIIDTGQSVEDLAQRSVYPGEGTVIETKRSDDAAKKSYSTMVYSNGTGAYFDADTRVEVKRFVQEPFTPNRTDMDTEPSVSQTQAFLARGAVGLCNSKMVSGSSMTYNTPHGSINIRGRKVVIEAKSGVTKISMLEGESTVRAGAADMGGRTVHSGEQAIIRSNGDGMPSTVEIMKIPPQESAQLDDKVAMACMAKKTVYFEVKDKSTGSSAGPGGSSNAPEGDGAPVTAFNNAGDDKPTATELVPVQVVPVNLPVEVTLSASRIENAPKPGN